MNKITQNLSILYLLLAGSLAYSQAPDHWESMLTLGSECQYLVPATSVDPLWTSITFDDSGWLSGAGGVGYGDDDDPTTIAPSHSVYCRYHIDVDDPGIISSLILDVDFDDGFVAYLNGTELARFNMGAAGTTTAWDQPADGLHEASLYQGVLPHRVLLEETIVSLLVNGDNVLAIEVHNESLTSSDLSSNVYLHAGINTSGTFFNQTPGWFHPPITNLSTHLPLVIIDTEGNEIVNDPRITARMGLIFNGPGQINNLDDPFNEYDGQISIELRGESSLWLYPKKSYSLETQTALGENNNVSLLGMPQENDFVLYAPYGDKSLIRNALTYSLFEKMGHYAPRTRFVEVVINEDYKGVYVLTEKIKRDKNRVDMAKLTPDDISPEDISGGYLLRIDKRSGLPEEAYWESPILPRMEGYSPVIYQYFDPGHDELTPSQKTYIQDYLKNFEAKLVNWSFKDPDTGYRSYLDIPSFTDMMILNEFTKDVDAFRLSNYFYKQNDRDGGKIITGPPWDYNLTYGNSDFSENIHQSTSWVHTLGITIYWWARIMQDPWFQNQLYCRWEELRSSTLSEADLMWLIDNLIAELGSAIPRNFQRWPILGLYVWPNFYVGENYEQEEEFLRSWISERLTWMDGKWGGLCVPLGFDNELILRPGTLRVYPNPSDLTQTFVAMDVWDGGDLNFSLFDLNGRLVFESKAFFSGGDLAYALPDLSFLPAGMYSLVVEKEGDIKARAKLIRQ